MLELKNIWVNAGNQKVLNGINLKIGKGETHILLGPNASGKSTLAKTIMGFSQFKVVKGRIIFESKEIQKLKTWERAKLGLFLVFQQPPSVKDITLNELLELISKQTNSNNKKIEKIFPNISGLEKRKLNVSFSGGEQKVSELIQLMSVKPKFVIFDEIDSGLDIVMLKKISRAVRNYLTENHITSLFITHRGDIMKYLNPDTAHVLLDGKIACSGDWKNVWKTVKKYGYEKCRKCPTRIS